MKRWVCALLCAVCLSAASTVFAMIPAITPPPAGQGENLPSCQSSDDDYWIEDFQIGHADGQGERQDKSARQ